jgi:cytochrome c556
MQRSSPLRSWAWAFGALLANGLAAPQGLSDTDGPAARAIEYRKAVYTVIGGNFGPLVAVLKRQAPYDPSDVRTRAERLAFMAGLAAEAFPDMSKGGASKAKPEIWTDPNGFKTAMQALSSSTAALTELLKTDQTDSAAFRTAVAKVAESCKGCHDKFKAK